MIQRIQSVLMALIVVALLVLFFVPVFQLKAPLLELTQGVCVSTKTVGVVSEQSYNFLSILCAVASMLITSFSITQYKNRPLQLKLGLGNTMALLGLLASMIFYKSGLVGNTPANIPGIEAKFGFGFFIPAVCLILNMISIRFIRRDERMVKDAFERLR